MNFPAQSKPALANSEGDRLKMEKDYQSDSKRKNYDLLKEYELGKSGKKGLSKISGLTQRRTEIGIHYVILESLKAASQSKIATAFQRLQPSLQ